MRRKPYLSLVLAVAILGGMLALFPALWMLLVIALIALVSGQVILVRRNLYTLPPGHTQVAMPPAGLSLAQRGATPVPGTAAPAPGANPATASSGGAPAAPATSSAPSGPAAPSARPEAAAAPAAAPISAAEPAAAARPNIDASLFSRFRRHLERAESEVAGTATPRPPPPLDETDVQDRVQLSSVARRSAPPRPDAPPAAPSAAARRPAAPAGEPDAADLFADLRPPPPLAPAPAKPPPVAPSPAAPPKPAPARPAASAARAPAAPTTPAAPVSPPAAPAGDEVSAALASGGRDAPGLADEAATLLHLAEDAAGRADWEALRAGLGNYVAHLAEAPRLIHWRGRRLQVRLAVHDRDPSRALQRFEELLDAGYRPAVDEVPALLDELLGGAEPEPAASLRVSMLVRILAAFRQARDQRAMDRCYGWIEEAQEQVGDERRLLQYLKNHLEIRKVLGDVPGQLELIDQLGNRCYRLGLTEEAKLYYEMGLRVRAEAEGGDTQPNRPGGAVREG